MARSLPEKIQQQVERAGIGSYVESKLTDGETLTGRLEATDEKFFTLELLQAESPQVQVNYDQVRQLEVIKKPSYLAAGKPDVALAKQAVEGLRVGTHIMVKVLEGTILRGHIQAIDEKHFTLRSDVRSQLIGISYHRVLQVEENNDGTCDAACGWFFLGIGVIIAVYFVAKFLIGRGGRPQAIPNPEPSIRFLSPSSILAASPTTGLDIVLTVAGNGFIEDSIVLWNGNARPTYFMNSFTLEADIPFEAIRREGAVRVTVFNPEPGGGTSDSATFIIRPQ
jgi:small nuclear ribonucleoprotein (snRNP)-like protein